MPFKSESQKRKMQQLVAAGKMTQAQYDKMAEGTPAVLPERVTPQNEEDSQ